MHYRKKLWTIFFFKKYRSMFVFSWILLGTPPPPHTHTMRSNGLNGVSLNKFTFILVTTNSLITEIRGIMLHTKCGVGTYCTLGNVLHNDTAIAGLIHRLYVNDKTNCFAILTMQADGQSYLNEKNVWEWLEENTKNIYLTSLLISELLHQPLHIYDIVMAFPQKQFQIRSQLHLIWKAVGDNTSLRADQPQWRSNGIHYQTRPDRHISNNKRGKNSWCLLNLCFKSRHSLSSVMIIYGTSNSLIHKSVYDVWLWPLENNYYAFYYIFWQHFYKTYGNMKIEYVFLFLECFVSLLWLLVFVKKIMYEYHHSSYGIVQHQTQVKRWINT